MSVMDRAWATRQLSIRPVAVVCVGAVMQLALRALSLCRAKRTLISPSATKTWGALRCVLTCVARGDSGVNDLAQLRQNGS